MLVRFGDDGSRGIYTNAWTHDMPVEGEFMTPDIGYRIGAAAVETLGLQKWVMVRDTRPFNAELTDAVKAGVASRGGKTIDVGILPTPAAAMLADELGKTEDEPHGAFSITSSHNKRNYGGVKVSGAGGSKLDVDSTERLQAQANIITSPSNIVHLSDQLPLRIDVDALREWYVAKLVRSAMGSRELDRDYLVGKDIVIDAANGAAFWSAPEALRRLGANVIAIHADPNGDINEGCGATEPESMYEEVRKSGVKIGFAFDGDADRVIAIAIDSDGSEQKLDGDSATIIALKGLINKGELWVPETVATDYSTVGYHREVARLGVEVHYVKNGDRFVAEKLEAIKGDVGAEKSGHILNRHVAVMNDMVMAGDGALAALQMLKVEAEMGIPLAQLSNWPTLGYSRVDVPLNGKNAKDVIASEGLQRAIKRNKARVGQDGMILERGSSTEPLLRFMVKTEGGQELADEIMNDLIAEVEKAA